MCIAYRIFGVTLVFFLLQISLNAQNVGVGTATPAQSAKLEVADTAKGVLIPRLSQSQRNAITSPAKGLLIYQTAPDSGFYYYTGMEWLPLYDANRGWSLTGNDGTADSIHFIGTTDSTDWVVRTDSMERVRVTATGKIGVGTVSPTRDVHVKDTSVGAEVTLNASTYPGISTGRATNQNCCHPSLDQFRWGGTLENPQPTPSGLTLGVLSFSGYDGTNIQAARIQVRATDTFGQGNPVDYPADMEFRVGENSNCCGIPRMTIKGSSGNVGLGTRNPDHRFHVKETGLSDTNTLLKVEGEYGASIGANEVTQIELTSKNTSGGGDEFTLNVANGKGFWIGEDRTQERLFVEANTGNIGVGTTSFGGWTGWSGNNRTLSMVHDDRPWLNLENTATDGLASIRYKNDTAEWHLNLEGTISDGFSIWGGADGETKTYRFYIDTVGNVGIGTTSPCEKLEVNGNAMASGHVTSCSDRRYKHQVRPLKNVLERIEKINGVTFSWKNQQFEEKNFPKGEDIGIIAQDIEEVYPQIVQEDQNGYKSLDYARLTPILLEGIKAQQKKIKRLEQDNQQKQKELTNVKQRLSRIENHLNLKAEQQ